jgi:hypothetical protein
LAIAKLLAKFDAIPLLESFCHFGRKLQCDARCVYTLTHTLAARDWGCLLAEKKSMYVHEGPLHLTTTAHLPCFVSFHGKKLHRILFEQASYFLPAICWLHVWDVCLALMH